MGNLLTVVAYLGPETMLPMTSILAGIAGVVMMFGRTVWNGTKGFFKKLGSRPNAKPASKLRRIGNGPMIRVFSETAPKDGVEA